MLHFPYKLSSILSAAGVCMCSSMRAPGTGARHPAACTCRPCHDCCFGRCLRLDPRARRSKDGSCRGRRLMFRWRLIAPRSRGHPSRRTKDREWLPFWLVWRQSHLWSRHQGVVRRSCMCGAGTGALLRAGSRLLQLGLLQRPPCPSEGLQDRLVLTPLDDLLGFVCGRCQRRHRFFVLRLVT